MDRLTPVPDAQAFVIAAGVYKQVDVYSRGAHIYVPHGGGFVRVCHNFGDGWPTTHPKVRVLEFDAPTVDTRLKQEPKLRSKA